MKLIDKDYAVDTAWSIEVYHGSAREVCEMLEDAPTVELIRCEECVHYLCGCYCLDNDWYSEPTDYCSKAERKER